MKKIYIKLIALVVLVLALVITIVLSPLCKKDGGKSEVEQGEALLNEARLLYSEGKYAAARDSIESLRKRFPTAIEARRQAILLMDSVELQLAEGDSLKQEFFRRKLEHDLGKRQ